LGYSVCLFYLQKKRTKEIGIRKVLGASVQGLVTVLSKDFIKLVLIALVISIPLAYFAANKWLENYPYRITVGWWLFASAAILVVCISFMYRKLPGNKSSNGKPGKEFEK